MSRNGSHEDEGFCRDVASCDGVDGCGRAVFSSGRINLKSSVAFLNGGTVSTEGDRIFENVRDLSLRVTDAITFKSGLNFGIVGSRGVSLTFDEGAALDCAQHNNYNIAFYLQGSSDVDVKFDNATADLYTVNIGGKDSGSLQPVSNLNWTECTSRSMITAAACLCLRTRRRGCVSSLFAFRSWEDVGRRLRKRGKLRCEDMRLMHLT